MPEVTREEFDELAERVFRLERAEVARLLPEQEGRERLLALYNSPEVQEMAARVDAGREREAKGLDTAAAVSP